MLRQGIGTMIRAFAWLALAACAVAFLWLLHGSRTRHGDAPTDAQTPTPSAQRHPTAESQTPTTAAATARTTAIGNACVLTGKVVDESGTCIAGAHVAVETTSPEPARFDGRTDAQGGFRLAIRGAAGAVRIVCTATPALRGEHALELPSDGQACDVGAIVVRHRVALTLRLEIGEREPSWLGLDAAARVEVLLRKGGDSLGAVLAREDLASFPLKSSGSAEQRCVVDCPAGATLDWQFRHAEGMASPLRSDPVPEHVEELTSICSLGPRSVLLGQVVSSTGVAQPGVAVQVVVDHPSLQFWELRSDHSGWFTAPISDAAFGVVRVKVEHGANSDIREGGVPWSPGEPVRLVADLNQFVRMRILLAGERVPRFRVSLHNDPFRDASGALEVRPSIHLREESNFVSEFSRLDAGQRLFVSIPGLGEFVHEVSRTWTATDGVYLVELSNAVPGQVGFRLSGALPPVDQGPATLRVHLVEERTSTPAASYRLQIGPDQLAATWICRQVIPGRYRCTTQWGRHQKTTAIEVTANSVAWVEVAIP